MIKELIWIGIGGFIGSIARYGASLGLLQYKMTIPWPTLLVNLLGSLLIGILAAAMMKIPTDLRLLLIPGFCGGFTTFSTFSLENIRLWQSGQVGIALLYILISLLGGIIFAGAGYLVTQKLLI